MFTSHCTVRGAAWYMGFKDVVFILLLHDDMLAVCYAMNRQRIILFDLPQFVLFSYV